MGSWRTVVCTGSLPESYDLFLWCSPFILGCLGCSSPEDGSALSRGRALVSLVINNFDTFDRDWSLHPIEYH